MNNIYRLVWNASLGVWMAVSEFAKAKGKGKSGNRKAKGLLSIGLLSVTLVAIPGSANAWVVNPSYVTNGSNAEMAAASDAGVVTNTAIGANSSAKTGTNAMGDKVQGNTALGSGAIASGVNSHDELTGATVTNGTGGATAVGVNSQALGERSIALGPSANAIAARTIAIGTESMASGTFSIALGTESKSTGFNSAAIGSASKAIGNYATAMGASAYAEGIRTTALGAGAKVAPVEPEPGEAKVDIVEAIAIGYQSEATASYAFAGGARSKATAFSSTAIGGGSAAAGESSTALGSVAKAMAKDSLALGKGATAGYESSVALGADSETGELVTTTRIMVNGKELGVKGNAVGTVSVGTGDKERTITNVAAGRVGNSSTDAINGSQLQAVIDTPMLFAGNSGGNIEKKLGENEPLSIVGGGGAQGNYTGYNLKTVVEDGSLKILMTDTPEFTTAKIGGNTLLDSTGLTITGGPSVTTSGIDAAGKQVTNVAAGSADTDAVNVSQLNTVITDGMKFAGNTGDVITKALGDTLKVVGASTTAGTFSGGNIQTATDSAGNLNILMADSPTFGNVTVNAGNTGKITGVTAGSDDTDAVNFSQLKDVKTTAEAGWNLADAEGNTHTIKSGETATFAAADGNLTVTQQDGTVTVELAKALELGATGSVTMGETLINHNGLTITGGPSVTTSGIDAAGKQVTNVAAGSADTDAVNVSQLSKTVTDATKYFHANSTGADSQALGLDAVAIGMGAIATNQNDVALGAGSVTAAVEGTAGVTINDKDYAFAGTAPTSTVSVGDVGAERTITHVAAGRLSATSTDAVNGSQLFATNTAVDNLHNEVGGLQDDALLWDANANGGQGAFSASHGDTTVNKITNVAAGELAQTSTDAVNGSQLFATNEQVATNTTNIAQNTQNITDLGDTVTTINNKGTKYFHANSTGADSQALGLDAVAIGMGAVATNQNDVALGAGSVTAAVAGTAGVTINGKDYAFAGTAPTSTVSVGDVGTERTITNVAAGRLSATSTDAVNGSQLFATNTAVDNLFTEIGGLQNDALLWDPALNAFSASHGDTTVNKITNVAAGELASTSTDAVNGSQLFATNEQVATNTTNIAQNTQNITDLGDTVTTINNKGTKYFHANSTGADSQALGLDAVAIGMGAVANHRNDVALGAGSVTADVVATAGTTIAGDNYLFAGATPGSTLSIGSLGAERTITNVAAGRLSATSTDAVNGSQLFATNTAVDNLFTEMGGLQNDALLWDPALNAFSASHGSTTVNKITNVAAGELASTSTDAVNGSQLYATNQKVENIDNRLVNVEEVVYGGIVPTMRYLKINSNGTDAVASGADAIALGQGTVASGDNSIATGNGAVSSGSGAIATGNNANASGESSVAIGENATVTANNSVALGAGSVADRDNTVSVGSAGNERQITNVAAGTQDTDAVNVAQLKEVSGDVSNISNTVNNVANGTDGMFQVNNTDKLAKPVVTGTNAMAGGAGSKASGKNSMAVGTSSSASGENSTALGNGSSATASNSVALGAGSVADRANAVSVGASGSERQITNVAAGTSNTDAVNLSQLKQTESNSYEYTNQQFSNLKNMVDDQKDKLSAGIAGAMAMSSLPQPYAPGASMFGLAGGTYQGQSAIALGVSTISDNGKWVTKLSGTTNSQGDVGAAVGIGYQW